MDHEAAGVMQIQPLRRGIGGHHHRPTPQKLRRYEGALVRGEATVQQHDLATHGRNPGAQPHRRIAVFGKNDGGGVDPGKETEESRCFAFGDG